MSFFPFRGRPWTPKPRKTRGFLIASRWNSGTPRGPKHRKTGCFLTPARARASGLWGRRPDYRRATAHAADPRFQRNLKQKGFGHFGHLRTRYKQRMNKIFGLLDLIRKRRVAGPAWARIRNSRNPSRIQAQWVAIWSAEPVPFGHLRTR